jgi:hypothetical protein
MKGRVKMDLKIKHIFRMRTEWWVGYKAIQFCFGRLSVHYKFLGWRNRSWRKGDINGNHIWKEWYSNPLFAVKKWDDERFSICIFYNDFTFQQITKDAMHVYYELA